MKDLHNYITKRENLQRSAGVFEKDSAGVFEKDRGLLKKSPNTVASVECHWLQKSIRNGCSRFVVS